MTRWYWCPSIESHARWYGLAPRRQFGVRLFVFGGVVWLGRRGWTVRVAVPR